MKDRKLATRYARALLASLPDDQAEDADGFLDEDGCPDMDNDADGVQDAEDQCPVESEDIDHF